MADKVIEIAPHQLRAKDAIGCGTLLNDPGKVNRVSKLEGYQADIVAPTAIDMLSDGLPQPFFLSVGFFETHREFLKPSSIKDANYSLPPAPLPDTPRTRLDMGAFK